MVPSKVFQSVLVRRDPPGGMPSWSLWLALEHQRWGHCPSLVRILMLKKDDQGNNNRFRRTPREILQVFCGAKGATKNLIV
jgi:hypothetical protein